MLRAVPLGNPDKANPLLFPPLNVEAGNAERKRVVLLLLLERLVHRLDELWQNLSPVANVNLYVAVQAQETNQLTRVSCREKVLESDAVGMISVSPLQRLDVEMPILRSKNKEAVRACHGASGLGVSDFSNPFS